MQLLVSGGPNSLSAVYSAMCNDIPVVAIADSGGCCLALYEYIEGRHAGTAERVPAAFQSTERVELLEKIAQARRRSKGATLCFFKLSDAGEGDGDLDDEDLTSTILATMVHHKIVGGDGEESQIEIEQAMMLAVKWNARPHVTAPLLEALKRIEPSRRAACLHGGLQRALELRRTEFVEMLLGLTGIDAMTVDMLRLYTMADERVPFLSRDPTLQESLQSLFREHLRRRRASSSSNLSPRNRLERANTVGGLGGGGGGGSGKAAGAKAGAKAGAAGGGGGSSSFSSKRKSSSSPFDSLLEPRALNLDYLRVVRPFFESISPQLTFALLSGGRSDPHLWTDEPALGMVPTRHLLAVDHLFCWATFRGYLPLAKCLWKRSKRPVHMALLGSFLLRKMEDSVYLEKHLLLEGAEEMQRWASGVMELLPSQEVAHRTLMHQSASSTAAHPSPHAIREAHLPQVNLIDFAMFLE